MSPSRRWRPAGAYSYDLPLDIPGTYWMHSHREFQEQRLMAAPLIVRDLITQLMTPDQVDEGERLAVSWR